MFMVSLIENLLGTYTQLPGDGLASVNWPWIVGAACWLLLLWFVLKLIIRLIQGSNRGGRL